MPLSLLIVAFVATTTPNTSAHERSPNAARAVKLVDSLNDPIFQTRERAMRALADLGRDAYAAVAAGRKHSSPEVRKRCEKLWPVVLENELRARVQAFVADSDDKLIHELPGWSRYRHEIGNDRVARDLFAGMVRIDPLLMDAVENQPHDDTVLERLKNRCTLVCNRFSSASTSPSNRPSPVEFAQLVFLGSQRNLSSPRDALLSVGQFMHQPEVRKWLAHGELAATLRKLLITMLENHVNELTTGYLIIPLMRDLQLRELNELGLRLIENKKAAAGVRAAIIVTLGRLRFNDAVGRLQPLIAESTELGTMQLSSKRISTQLGDVALAMSLHLSGQDLFEYGFEGARGAPGSIFTPMRLGFENEVGREKARQKWNEWRATQRK